MLQTNLYNKNMKHHLSHDFTAKMSFLSTSYNFVKVDLFYNLWEKSCKTFMTKFLFFFKLRLLDKSCDFCKIWGFYDKNELIISQQKLWFKD